MSKFYRVFFGMLLFEAVWVGCVKATADGHALLAGFWSACFMGLNMFLVGEYISDKRMVYPVMAGAFVGAMGAVLWMK